MDRSEDSERWMLMSSPRGKTGRPEVDFLRDMLALYRQLSRARHRQLHVLMGMMLLGALAEFASISAVLPFISLLTGASDPASKYFPAFRWIGVGPSSHELFAATAAFLILVIVSGIVRFKLASLTQRFGFDVLNELMVGIQRRFLRQPYKFHVARNSSALISSINKVEILVVDVLIPVMQALIAAFITIFIIVFFLNLDATTTVVVSILLAATFFITSVVTNPKLRENSAIVSRGFDERQKILQESLKGIRDVIIDGTEETYLEVLARENIRLGNARAATMVIASAPRFIIEVIGYLALAAVALYLSQRQGGFPTALPMLGAYALGAQRLLPLLAQMHGGFSRASGHLSVVNETVRLMNLPVESDRPPSPQTPLRLGNLLSVRNVSYAHEGRRPLSISDVSFQIPAGTSVAIVGDTGSGKSTMADLLMGLIEPADGEILIDGAILTRTNRAKWYRSIGHVPQSIFIADTTIARNIGLSVPEVELDTSRVIKAAKEAQLHDFVATLPDGYDTIIGEDGVRLSGGQRQRLGIARAIYKRPSLFVLDEATNALDEHTEAAVIHGLRKLLKSGRTLIMISHRASTVASCDMVLRLKDGKIVDVTRAN